MAGHELIIMFNAEQKKFSLGHRRAAVKKHAHNLPFVRSDSVGGRSRQRLLGPVIHCCRPIVETDNQFSGFLGDAYAPDRYLWASGCPTNNRLSESEVQINLSDPRCQRVLDAVVDYLPDPTEVPAQPEIDLEGNETGNLAEVDPNGPVRALAFKIMDDRFGALTFVRVYSGVINKGDTLVNTFTGKNERIGRMVEMHADDRTIVDSVQAGDIVAMVGLKDVRTGHTLADQKNPATLEPMVFPDLNVAENIFIDDLPSKWPAA